MDEYVSRELLKKRFKKRLDWLKKDIHDEYSLGLYDGCEYDTKLIDEIPAADVVPVVRCRECKYWSDEDGELQRSDGVLFARCKVHNYLLDGRHTGWCPTENDFCSYGERKEGAD